VRGFSPKIQPATDFAKEKTYKPKNALGVVQPFPPKTQIYGGVSTNTQVQKVIVNPDMYY
jgi:hypothetical protein